MGGEDSRLHQPVQRAAVAAAATESVKEEASLLLLVATRPSNMIYQNRTLGENGFDVLTTVCVYISC